MARFADTKLEAALTVLRGAALRRRETLPVASDDVSHSLVGEAILINRALVSMGTQPDRGLADWLKACEALDNDPNGSFMVMLRTKWCSGCTSAYNRMSSELRDRFLEIDLGKVSGGDKIPTHPTAMWFSEGKLRTVLEGAQAIDEFRRTL